MCLDNNEIAPPYKEYIIRFTSTLILEHILFFIYINIEAAPYSNLNINICRGAASIS